MTGQKDDFCAGRKLLEPCLYFQAIHDRHAHIEQHDGKLMRRRVLEKVGWVLKCCHVQTGRSEKSRNRFQHGRIIVEHGNGDW